jgi:hypothetical protein
MSDGERGGAWSEREVRLIVDDYFSMLKAELANQKYRKADHIRALMPKLNRRSKGSIEFKYANVSAVLSQMHTPWIIGYKPRWNFQAALVGAAEQYLKSDDEFDSLALCAMEKPAIRPDGGQYQGLLVPAPIVSQVRDPASRHNLVIRPVKRIGHWGTRARALSSTMSVIGCISSGRKGTLIRLNTCQRRLGMGSVTISSRMSQTADLGRLK